MAEATPRPWHWDGNTLLGTTDEDDHVITGSVCPACVERSHFCLSGRPANRALIVEAVNRFDALRRIEAAARRYVDAAQACRAGAEGAIRDKGASVAFDEGYDPLEVAVAEFTDAEADLRAALDVPADCHICHRPLTGDDWRTFDDNGRIYAVCGVCISQGDEG